MSGDDRPTRSELIAARDRLQGQLEVVANPQMNRDRNPQLEAKLKAMIDEIAACLAEPDREES